MIEFDIIFTKIKTVKIQKIILKTPSEIGREILSE